MRIGIALLVLVLLGAFAWRYVDRGDTPDRAGRPRGVQPEGDPPPAPPPDSSKGASNGTAETKAPAPAIAFMVGSVTGDAPLHGVKIEAEWDGGVVHNVTNAKGEYVLAISRPAKNVTVRLRADADDGRVGLASGWVNVAEKETKQQNIKLVAGANLKLRALEPGGAGVLGAAVRLERMTSPPGMTDHKFPYLVKMLRSGRGGEVSLRVAQGEYRAFAQKAGFGRGRAHFKIGAGEHVELLQLSAERQLKVIVRDVQTKNPVAGATVHCTEQRLDYGNEPAVSDEHGEAFPKGIHLDDEPRILVLPPGEERTPGPGRHRTHAAKKGVDEIVVEIDLPRTISWEVRDGDIPVPPDGTKIRITKQPGTTMTPPPEGVMENGRLVVADCPAKWFHGIAHGPKGTAARLWCAQDKSEGRPFEFKRACNIDYTIMQADGSPAAGVNISIFNQGNNAMAKAKTDAAGKARMESLFGELAEIKLVGSMEYQILGFVGTVDLRNGDLNVRYSLPDRRPVAIQATTDGKPGLPEAHRLWMGWLQLADMKIDREAGTITATVALPRDHKKGETISAWLSASGYRTAKRELTIPEGNAPLRASFELIPGVDCRVRETGKRPERFDVALQHLHESGAWRTVDSSSAFPRKPRKETEDGWIFLGLDPGRYRLIVHREELVLAETDVQPGGANTLALDYAKLVEVKGRVEIPEGHDSRLVVLEWERESTGNVFHTLGSFRTRRVRVDHKTGAFRALGLPGARMVVSHPALAPDPAAGSFTVAGPTDTALLKLVEGPTIRFRISEYFKRNKQYADHPKFRRPGVIVLLYRDTAMKDRVFAGRATATEREWVLGGFTPGTYTMFVDVPTAVPLIRHGVKLAAGDNDLGDLPMADGATIRIRVLVSEPFVAPRVSAFVTSLAQPRFTRGLNSGGEAEVILKGLLPGRYTLTASAVMTGMGGGAGARINEEIEVTAEGGPELTLDLR